MSTSMNKNRPQTQPTVGLLLIIGDSISNEQRDDVCLCVDQALQRIDSETYRDIHDLFNHLIHENEFQTHSQYRQIANTETGSTAGFLYLPNFHTLSNVLKDIFNACQNACIIFCGQQIESNGAWIVSDSTFTTENFRQLFDENPAFVLQDLQLVLPLVSSQWSKLTHHLQKHVEYVRIHDVFHPIEEESSFGQRFYERLMSVLQDESVNFDIYGKLPPRDSSGTIAFDEPNLYVFYGHQGEASLFGIRGFVVLVNGGFSRIPPYWNIIRGLQTLDACILTHFDYDVFPGLQTIVERKQILASHDDQWCKPDIGAFFLNQTQRTKLQASSASKPQSNNRLLVNLTADIDQFVQNVKQLNIETFNLVKHSTANKQTVEPINLYKKIAFGSLDLWVLHPTSSATEDEKLVAALQKIPIGDQQHSSANIPHHHWFSSCLLLTWTPTVKSNKDTPVSILYTGACPQTLVFEALGKVRHLDFLHASQTRAQTPRASHDKPTPPARASSGVHAPPQKSKPSPPVKPRPGPPAAQNRTPKPPPRPAPPKPKPSRAPSNSSKPVRSASPAKKATDRTASKQTKPKTIGAAKPIRPSAPKARAPAKPKPDSKPQAKSKKEAIIDTAPKQELLRTDEMVEQWDTPKENDDEPLHSQFQHEEEEEEEEQPLDVHHEPEEGLLVELDDTRNVETEVADEPAMNGQNYEYDQSDENEQSLGNDLDEQQYSGDDYNEHNDFSGDNLDDSLPRPQSISSDIDQHDRFVPSNSNSPVHELASQLSPGDPMTTSFTEGVSDADDPFTEINHNHTETDDVEIVHHHSPLPSEHRRPSDDDVHPQGLPIEKNASPKSSSAGQRSHKPTTQAAASNHPRSANGSTRQTNLGSIFHVDVAYIPYHGNEQYVDSEFFRRIRARYYILNGVQTSARTLENFLDGIAQWNGKGQRLITLVPTFDSEQLRHFFVVNKNRLAELHVNILPASSRCHVQYDNESAPAQLLRFGLNAEASMS